MLKRIVYLKYLASCNVSIPPPTKAGQQCSLLFWVALCFTHFGNFHGLKVVGQLKSSVLHVKYWLRDTLTAHS